MSTAFVKALLRTHQPGKGAGQSCMKCYRPNLKQEHVGIYSNHEVYCKFCVEKAI